MNQTPARLPDSLQIYTDGGSRGNPGHAAGAYTARLLSSSQAISENSVYLGQTTNNVAEYRAIILALTWLLEQPQNFVPLVDFFSDSQLVVNQINGDYRIRDINLYSLFTELSELLKKLRETNHVQVRFNYVPREQNKRADELVNQTLDNLLK